MKVTTVSITYKRKFNLGDYKSAELGATLWADLEEGDDVSACTKALWSMAKENVKAQSLPMLEKEKEKIEQANIYMREYFAGLPVANNTH